MATTYPTTIDVLANPTATTLLDAAPGHARQHADVNDAVEAIETKVGVGASNQAPVADTVLAGTGAGTTEYKKINNAHIDNRTRNERFGVNDFTARAAGPTITVPGTNTRYRAWAFDSTTAEDIIAEYVLPEEFVSAVLTFKLWWTNLGAGAGDVRWQITTKAVADTGDLNATAGETVTGMNVTAPAQDILKVTTHTIAITPAGGNRILPFIIGRLPADVGDTLGNDAGIVAVEIEFTADM